MNFRITLLLFASLGSSHAFTTSSTFTRRMPLSPTRQSSSPSYRSTALSMNLFDRFQRVAKANLNNVLKTLEDPEKIMTQALEDMQVRGVSSYEELMPIVSFCTASQSFHSTPPWREAGPANLRGCKIWRCGARSYVS